MRLLTSKVCSPLKRNKQTTELELFMDNFFRNWRPKLSKFERKTVAQNNITTSSRMFCVQSNMVSAYPTTVNNDMMGDRNNGISMVNPILFRWAFHLGTINDREETVVESDPGGLICHLITWLSSDCPWQADLWASLPGHRLTQG